MAWYLGVVGRDPDTPWGIWFPDVPGCVSVGEGYGELHDNAREALGLHLEGLDAPPARTLDGMLGEPDVRECLADGGFLMAIPVAARAARWDAAAGAKAADG